MIRTWILAITVLFPVYGYADVVSEVRDIKFEVRTEGQSYRYVMLDTNGAEKWRSRAYSKSGQAMSGAPLAPQEIAEDLTLAAATGDLPVTFDGSKYYVGDIQNRKPLSSITENDLKLTYGIEARKKSSLWPIVERYRQEVSQLQSELSSCRQSPSRSQAPIGTAR